MSIISVSYSSYCLSSGIFKIVVLECQIIIVEIIISCRIVIRDRQNFCSGLSKLLLGKSKLSLGEAKLLLGIAIIVVMNCQNCHLRMVKVLLGVVRNSQKSSTSCLSSLSHRIKG